MNKPKSTWTIISGKIFFWLMIIAGVAMLGGERGVWIGALTAVSALLFVLFRYMIN